MTVRVALTAVLLAAFTAAGCGGSAARPPEIAVDRTSCDHCRMLISDVRYAAAVEGPAGSRVFDDIGCLLDALEKESPDQPVFWFRDASDGEWIPGEKAIFVSSPGIRTPMSGGVIAYRDRTAAVEAARRENGKIVDTIAELLAVKRAGS